MPHMRCAFKAVKRNRGAAGVDKVDIRAFEANLEQNLAALMFDLKYPGRYHASPLRRVFIPKGEGKLRPLGIPTVRDRVAQDVIRSLLEPIFEPLFSESSFGFRPGRSAHQAIQAVTAAQKRRYSWVVDADIQSFFDTIPHDLIINLVAEQVAELAVERIEKGIVGLDLAGNEADFSAWNGQQPQNACPLRVSFTRRPTSWTISVRRRISSSRLGP